MAPEGGDAAVARGPAVPRLDFIDWLRGLAVLLMFQAHAFDAWLLPEARETWGFAWSRLIAGFPAPLFLFVAGMGLALGAEGRLRRGASPRATAWDGVRRVAEVFAYGILFRLFMFATGGFSNPGALLRVDILNCIGLSMILVSCLALPWAGKVDRLVSASCLSAGIAVATPWIWDGFGWPRWIPVAVAAYLDGRLPQALFPAFPWAGFLAGGVAAGLLIAWGRATGRLVRQVVFLATAGLAAIPVGLLLDRLPTLSPRYDFWWTSPNYFLVKVGILLLLVGLAFLWSQAPWGRWWSPLRQMGRTSLLVYWVHIEIVYGAIVLPWARHRLDWSSALIGFALLTAAMVTLSLLRTEWPRLRHVALVRPLGLAKG